MALSNWLLTVAVTFALAAGERIFTDDVSLRVFMEHLMKLAVQS